jgi:hypothetical protein
MWETAAILALGLGALLWVDALRARERALAAGRRACERSGVQFLDETVAGASVRLARDADGRVRLQRTYTFEFSDTGDNRRQGSIVVLGADVSDLHMEPYRAQ